MATVDGSHTSRTGPPFGSARTLTIINLLLPGLVVCSFAALRLTGAPAIDRMAPVFFWSWLVGAPLVAGLAIRRARQGGSRGLVRLNVAALVMWALTLLGSLLLH